MKLYKIIARLGIIYQTHYVVADNMSTVLTIMESKINDNFQKKQICIRAFNIN